MIPTYLGVLVPTQEHADWVREKFPYPDLFVTTYDSGFTGKRLHALVIHYEESERFYRINKENLRSRLAPKYKDRKIYTELGLVGEPDDDLVRLIKFLHDSYEEDIAHETETCPK